MMFKSKYDVEIHDTIAIIKLQMKRAGIILHNIKKGKRHIEKLHNDYNYQLEALDTTMGALDRLLEKKEKEK